MGSRVWTKKMVSHTYHTISVFRFFKIFTVYRWKQASVFYVEENIEKEESWMPKQRECFSSSRDLEGRMEERRDGGGREGEGREEVLITFLTNIQKLIICSNSLNIIAQEGETYIFLLTLISFYILSHSKAILKSSAHFLHTLRCLCYMFVKLTKSTVFKIKLTCTKSTCQGYG